MATMAVYGKKSKSCGCGHPPSRYAARQRAPRCLLHRPRPRGVPQHLLRLRTIAGSGTNGYSGDGGAATSADLAFPGAVVLGPSDSFYISDEMNNVIREVNAGTSPFPVSPAAGEEAG